MQQLTTPARLVEHEMLGDSVATVLRRSDLEEALAAEQHAQLWFELGREDEDEVTRLTVELGPEELAEILRRSTGEEVGIALDGSGLAELVADPDVEAHGLRGALAIAVTTAAIVAPAGLAATPQTAGMQTAGTQATAQRAQAAASVQRAGLAANPQVASLAAKTQVAPQRASAAKKAQITAARASGLTLLRAGIAR